MVYCTRPQVRLLASQDGWGIHTINGIHCRPTQILWVWPYVFWPSAFSSHIPKVNGNILDELQINWCLIYLNNIIVFSKTPKEHLIQLRAVFQKLKEVELKLNPSMCEFFKRSLTYLGHKILEKGIETADHKIKVIQERPTPKMITEIRSVLGFTNYYGQFISRYAQFTQPLYCLILGENVSMNKAIVWDGECVEQLSKS